MRTGGGEEEGGGEKKENVPGGNGKREKQEGILPVFFIFFVKSLSSTDCRKDFPFRE